MVIYNLTCEKNHRFEGWFPSFEDYQKQIAKGQISCPNCGSTKIEKVPHACAVISHRGNDGVKEKRERVRRAKAPDRQLTEADAKELLIRLHHYVKENFEDVGPRFAEEARSIFHGQSKRRAVHGTSTAEEREGLDEEGIPYAILPKPELDS